MCLRTETEGKKGQKRRQERKAAASAPAPARCLPSAVAPSTAMSARASGRPHQPVGPLTGLSCTRGGGARTRTEVEMGTGLQSHPWSLLGGGCKLRPQVRLGTGQSCSVSVLHYAHPSLQGNKEQDQDSPTHSLHLVPHFVTKLKSGEARCDGAHL